MERVVVRETVTGSEEDIEVFYVYIRIFLTWKRLEKMCVLKGMRHLRKTGRGG